MLLLLRRAAGRGSREAARRALRFSAVDAPGLAPAPGKRLACVTDGKCSCRLVRRDRADREQALRAKYRKRGWSAAKIERALSDARRAREKTMRGNVHQDAF